jgi:hypothetical protein
MDDARSLFICNICNDYLNDPVNLPCHCTVCNDHLTKSEIKCQSCNETFVLPHEGIRENKKLKQIIERGGHLTEEERNFKQTIEKSIESIEDLFEEYNLKETEFDRLHSAHFQKLEESINERSKLFKAKIDEITNGMIDKLKISKAKYEENKLLNRPYNNTEDFQNLLNKFKNMNRRQKEIYKMKLELDYNLSTLKSRLGEIDLWKVELKKYKLTEFKCEKRLLKPYFGSLKHHEVKTEIVKNEFITPETKLDKSSSSCSEFSLKQKELDIASIQSSNSEITILSNRLPTLPSRNIIENIPYKNKIDEDTQDVIETKRPRKCLNDYHREMLENIFLNQTQYPDQNLLYDLSKKLKISSIAVQNWFRNKRVSLKINLQRKFYRPRMRKFKTQEQIKVLEEAFEKNKFPTGSIVRKLAEKINLPDLTVYQWFANTRNKKNISKGKNSEVGSFKQDN